MEIWDRSINSGDGINTPVRKGNLPYTGTLHHLEGNMVVNFENGLINGNVVYDHGQKEWCQHGKLHREDGPAVEYPNGTKKWFIHGKRHRVNGPAVEFPDGSKAWFVNGERHRLDGPAYIWSDGDKEWWVDGKEVDIFAIFAYEPSVPLTEEEQMVLLLNAGWMA